jgi:hypothetical protein
MAKRPASFPIACVLLALALALLLAGCPAMRCLWGCNGEPTTALAGSPSAIAVPGDTSSVAIPEHSSTDLAL